MLTTPRPRRPPLPSVPVFHHFRLLTYIAILIAAFAALVYPVAAGSDPGKIKLSQVQRLTLRNGMMTTGRRTKPVPQLKCVGGDAKGLYEVDVMICKNMGSDYGDTDVTWSCTADLPSYFKLGSTDVYCEGYSHPDDPYVLKGS
ncbi:hypothetical protein BDZ91DRAFT_664454, partial [Kalaharituber pfeilii]